jgi:hypothetical protein
MSTTVGQLRSGLSEGAGGGVRVPAGKQAGFLDRTVSDLLQYVKAKKSHPDEYGGLSSTLQKIELEGEMTEVQRQRMIDLDINERIAEMTRKRITSSMKKGLSPGASHLT